MSKVVVRSEDHKVARDGLSEYQNEVNAFEGRTDSQKGTTYKKWQTLLAYQRGFLKCIFCY